MTDTNTKINNINDKPTSTDLERLFEAGAHIGHSKVRRNPKMSKYIFGIRNNIEIFNLQLTESKLKEAEGYMYELGKNKKLVLFVGSKPAARKYVSMAAKRLGMPCVTERWLGGVLTNFKAMEARLAYWQNLEREVNDGGLDKYVKKERILKLTELRKLTRMFGGLRSLTRIPDAIVIIDPKEENTATQEARKKNLKIIALLNNDCNPEEIAYPIPANDDSAEVISVILDHLTNAYETGKRTNTEPSIIV
ncbi:MAG: 30S ribosomal protein S2 [Patescibacteria group bacterium]